MDAEEIRNYCIAKPDATESFPFGPAALVFKTSGKVFALLMLDAVPLRINLKCDPEIALQLRDHFECVLPGYHMNKKHWNTVLVEPWLDSALLRDWIDNSYNLVRPKSTGPRRNSRD